MAASSNGAMGGGAALVYCRVSTINQAEEGTSLDSQETAGVAHARGLGYTVGRVTREVYSGAEPWDRPKLSQDRADLKAGHFAALVCYATDRLSRDPIHLAISAEECERTGVALHFVSETFDDSDEAALIRYIKGYSSKKEREKIRERSLRGKHTRALQGKVHNAGSELFGYRRDKERGVRLIYEPEAAIIRCIFEWVARDCLSLRAGMRRLNDEGIPPPSVGKFTFRDPDRPAPRWCKKQVRCILDGPAYKGEAYAWRWRHWPGRGKSSDTPAMRPEREWVRLPDGVVPAIVTPALWQEAHDVLTAHRGETTRNQTRPYLLRGHIFCAVCGRRMEPTREHASTTHERRIYRCSSRDTARIGSTGAACGCKRVRADEVEAWAWSKISFALKHPEVIAADRARRQAEGPDPILTDDLDKARRAVARCEREQRKLVGRLRTAEGEEGGDTSRLWKPVEEEINALETERAGWQKTIDQIESRLADERLADEQLEALQDACARWGANLENATFEDQWLAVTALGVVVKGNGAAWKIDGRIPLEAPEPVVALQATTCW